ncbi:MAG: VWA domain-containing protein [Polyangiaceae bacterium]|nr:VWA domain-containing protein [Polyangiaceae bacterium]
MRLALSISFAACLALVGCSTTNDGSVEDDDGGSFNDGGSGPGNGSGGGGAAVGLEEGAVGEDVNSPEAGSACEPGSRDPGQLLRVRPRSVGGFASAQYARAAIASGQWPDPVVLRLDDFVGYYQDRIVLPAEIPLEVRGLVSQIDEVNASISLSARLPVQTARSPVHIIAVTDVSESTGGFVGTRDGALDALASRIASAETDSLSVVAFGDPPEIIFEHATGADAQAQLSSNKPRLQPRTGNDLLGALAAATDLAAAGESTHILLLTDGGVAWGPDLEKAIVSARDRGIVTSVAQVGRDNNTDAPLFLNDALLENIARTGDGTRLYLPPPSIDEASEAELALRGRYDALFTIASSKAWLEITLPSGVTAVTESFGEPSSGPVGYGRPVGLTFDVVAACDTAFQSEGSSFQVALVTEDGPMATGALPLAIASGAVPSTDPTAQVNVAITRVVKALRSRSGSDLAIAHEAVSKISLDGQTACPELVPDVCEPSKEICCVRSDLLELVAGACSLAGEACDNATTP